jgi:putative heme-binding domain-containing protein
MVIAVSPFEPGARRRATAGFLVAGALVLTCQHAAAQVSGAPYSSTDVQFGARVYASQCTVCHGTTGQTVAGVSVLSGRFTRASGDGELRALLTAGIPGTAMPPFNFTAAEMAGIIAYLRKARELEGANVAIGDPARGRAIFDEKGACGTCHRVHGRGPRLSPDLSNVGALRTADALERSLVDPTGGMQFSNRSVRAVTRDGRVVTGRRMNEDTYTVLLIDPQERLVSLLKSDLREYRIIEESAMPSYKDRLSAAERADVLAYLLTLKGQPDNAADDMATKRTSAPAGRGVDPGDHHGAGHR